MNASLMLISFGFLFAILGIWRFLRRRHPAHFLLALSLLLLATASLYIGTRLWVDSRKAPDTSFVLQQTPGQFQVVPAAKLSNALLAAQGKPVLLEFYADWCSSCIVWKNTVFNRQDVQKAMSPLVLLQIDASEITPDVQHLLNRYNLIGLPAILVIDQAGKEKPQLRLLGEMSAEQFIQWLQQTLFPSL
jgi:thiol:disulfide interchange protein DsbD